MALFLVKFVNGCGDHVAVLVDVENSDHAEQAAREAMATGEGPDANWRYSLNCEELDSITPVQPVLQNAQGSALVIEMFDHEDGGCPYGVL